jgi:ABC-2 type transport system permease protein
VTAFHALLRKELLEVARNRGALFPVAIVTLLSLALPFLIGIVVPALSGHHIGADEDLLKVSRTAGAPATLSEDGQVQLFLFEQCLLLFLMAPITGAMAFAAHAIVGEKQARTLEPLLASPISTAEFLLAKVVGALVPTLAFSVLGVTLYFTGIALLAEPGVVQAFVTGRTLLLIFVIGPLAALASLQFAILVSSRVNDARTAQQFGVFIILPLTGLLVAQFTGAFWLTSAQMGWIGLGLAGLWLLLTAISIPLFDREAILTKWR